MTQSSDLPHLAGSPAPSAKTKLPFALQGDETLLLYVRRHWWYFYSRLAMFILFGVIATGAVALLVANTYGFDGALGTTTLIVLLVWFGYWAVRDYFLWYSYHHDVWAVTNQRLIDSNKRNWFNHEMASADLVDVTDMRVERSGILQTTLNFGDVRCQTAGTMSNFVLSGIPKPTSVLAVVDSARDASRRSFS